MQALVSVTLLAALSAFASDTKRDAATVSKLLSDASDIGLPVGTLGPDFRLKDQNDRERDRRSLAGPNGLVLVFFRSADW
jgi:hypothetical protein